MGRGVPVRVRAGVAARAAQSGNTGPFGLELRPSDRRVYEQASRSVESLHTYLLYTP